MFIATMVEPTGVSRMMADIMPDPAAKTDTHAEHIVTDRNVLNTLIAERAGNITRADISRDPTRFIARTTITAMITAISRLYKFAFVPVALAKSSSNVTANILL